MSPYASQQWTRRIRYGDQHIRVSDAERGAVADRLAAHYAEGRLDQAEFDDRVSRTMAAKTRGDLTGLFDDLPDAAPAGGLETGDPGGLDGPPLGYRPRRRRGALIRPLLLFLLVLAGASVAWHVFTRLFFIGSLAWAVLVVFGIVFLLSRLARHRDR